MRAVAVLAVGVIGASLLSVAPARAEEPKAIRPEEARRHVGEKCAVTFKVRHAKHGVHRKTFFLDSREDFRAPENLGIQIGEEMAAQLKEKKGLADPPHVHFADRTIRVTGTVFLQEDRPYIRVENVDDIRLVDEK